MADSETGERQTADSQRIEAEVLGLDSGTDPFVAAVRATRMPMIITNPRLDDNPVVFANDSFCKLTGYDRDEILGRNCRFLQGAETDPAAVQALHDAVAAPDVQDITGFSVRASATGCHGGRVRGLGRGA
jgi:PAS domain-containing protein